MKKRIIAYLVLAQAIIILVIVYGIYVKKNSVDVSVNPVRLSKVSTSSSKFKYFHEPSNEKQYIAPWVNFKFDQHINKDTIKSDIEFSYQKAKDVFRIITIGDSFTYGLYVGNKFVWPSILQDQLNKNYKCSKIKKFEVINLGAPGYDIQYETERYIRRGVKYDPDLVVWMVLDNDFAYIEEDIAPSIKNARSTVLSEGEDENSPEFMINVYKEVGRELKAPDEIFKSEQDRILSVQIAKLKEFSGYYKKDLVIYGLKHAFDEDRNIKALKKFASSRKKTYFFRNTNDEWYRNTLLDKHPNKEGHAIIAKDIFEYLKKNGVIPCKVG
jgi:lysophospholipase L1-like esterase